MQLSFFLNQGPKKPRQPSGYIVFAGEYRKTVQEQNPDSSFGEISKIVGTKVSRQVSLFLIWNHMNTIFLFLRHYRFSLQKDLNNVIW